MLRVEDARKRHSPQETLPIGFQTGHEKYWPNMRVMHTTLANEDIEVRVCHANSPDLCRSARPLVELGPRLPARIDTGYDLESRSWIATARGLMPPTILSTRSRKFIRVSFGRRERS